MDDSFGELKGRCFHKTAFGAGVGWRLGACEECACGFVCVWMYARVTEFVGSYVAALSEDQVRSEHSYRCAIVDVAGRL